MLRSEGLRETGRNLAVWMLGLDLSTEGGVASPVDQLSVLKSLSAEEVDE